MAVRTNQVNIVREQLSIQSQDKKIKCLVEFHLFEGPQTERKDYYVDKIEQSINLIIDKLEVKKKTDISLSVFGNNELYKENCNSNSCKMGGGFTIHEHSYCYIQNLEIYNLTHELCHAIIHTTTSLSLPETLSEGIPQYVQGYENINFLHSLTYETIVKYYNEIIFNSISDLLNFKTTYHQTYVYALGVLVVHWAITRNNYTLSKLLTDRKSLTHLKVANFRQWLKEILGFDKLSPNHNIFLFTPSANAYPSLTDKMMYATVPSNTATTEKYQQYCNKRVFINAGVITMYTLREMPKSLDEEYTAYAIYENDELQFFNKAGKKDKNIIIDKPNINFLINESQIRGKKLIIEVPEVELDSVISFSYKGVRVAELLLSSIHFETDKVGVYEKTCFAIHPSIYFRIAGFFGRVDDNIYPITIVGFQKGKPIIRIHKACAFSIYILPKEVREGYIKDVISIDEEPEPVMPGTLPIERGIMSRTFNTTTTDDDVADAVVSIDGKVIGLPSIQYRHTIIRDGTVTGFAAFSTTYPFDYRYNVGVTCKLVLIENDGVAMPCMKLNDKMLVHKGKDTHLFGAHIPLYYFEDTDHGLINFDTFVFNDVFEIKRILNRDVLMKKGKWIAFLRSSYNIFVGEFFFSVDKSVSLHSVLYTRYPKVFVEKKNNAYEFKFAPTGDDASKDYVEHAMIKYPMNIYQFYHLLHDYPKDNTATLLTRKPRSVSQNFYVSINTPNDETREIERLDAIGNVETNEITIVPAIPKPQPQPKKTIKTKPPPSEISSITSSPSPSQPKLYPQLEPLPATDIELLMKTRSQVYINELQKKDNIIEELQMRVDELLRSKPNINKCDEQKESDFLIWEHNLKQRQKKIDNEKIRQENYEKDLDRIRESLRIQKEDLLHQLEEWTKQKNDRSRQIEEEQNYRKNCLANIEKRIKDVQERETAVIQKEAALKKGLETLKMADSKNVKEYKERVQALSLQNESLQSARRRMCYHLRNFPGDDCETKFHNLITGCSGPIQDVNNTSSFPNLSTPEIIEETNDDLEQSNPSMENEYEIPPEAVDGWIVILGSITFLLIVAMVLWKIKS